MNKISCDICLDLMPLVKDEVASEDSKTAVLEHLKTCKSCSEIYGKEVAFVSSNNVIVAKIKKNITLISLAIITLGVLFGISLSISQFMFYNVLIMPAIGAMAFFTLKYKSAYVLLAVFVLSYIKGLYNTFGHIVDGNYMSMLVGPLWWAVIYVSLAGLGVVIAMLINYALKKEMKNEENN